MATHRRYLDIGLSDFDGCDTLADWRAMLDTWEAMIPEQWRSTAIIRCRDDYDDGIGIEAAYYEIAETALEQATRERAEREQAAKVQATKYAEERELYERLKAKFEPIT